MSAVQIPFELTHKPSWDLSDFIVSSSNEEAFSLVDDDTVWPGHAAVIVGPAGCGKTHLGQAWATRHSGLDYSHAGSIADIPNNSYVLVEDVDISNYKESDLFHLYNWIKEGGGKLLFTARTAPASWSVDLPDLKSRLATLTVGRISEPDDELLMVLLAKLFSDRQLQVDMTVISYVLPRIERSFERVRQFVEALDQAALVSKSRITRNLAKACLMDIEK